MKTAWSFEVPIPHLEDFESDQDFFFILSFLCKDEKYFSFHKHHSQYGYRKCWLDNSYNELGTADDVHELVKNFLEIKADKLIAPDDLSWSIDQITESYQQCASRVINTSLITVVNTEDMYKALHNCGARHFALPYKTRLSTYTCGFPPGIFTWASRMHFLGLCSIEEIQQLRPPTCDTSMPIKLALRGWDLRRWYSEGEPHIHTKDICDSFFTSQLSKAELALAKENIKLLKEITQ